MHLPPEERKGSPTFFPVMQDRHLIWLLLKKPIFARYCSDAASHIFLNHAPKSFHGSFEVIGRCRRKHVHSIFHHTLIKVAAPIGNLTLSDLLLVSYLHACRRAYVFSAGENGGYPPTKNGDIRSLLCA